MNQEFFLLYRFRSAEFKYNIYYETPSYVLRVFLKTVCTTLKKKKEKK